MSSIYTQDPPNTEALQFAFQVLVNGDRLFGENPDNLDHVWWAVKMVLENLKAHRQDTEKEQPEDIGVFLEIGHDTDRGVFISVLRAGE